MKKIKLRTLMSLVGGVLLVAAGVIFLLANLDIITLDWEILVGPMFGIAGLIFLVVFILNTTHWWALIPGFVLMGIGIIIFMSQTMESTAELWSGAIFLGMIGLAFWLIYITHRNHWWAIIPGGILLTLAVVTLMPEKVLLSGGVFFLGLALTFGLVYILPKPDGKSTWAIFPAIVLLLIGLLVVLDVTNLIDFIWPVALLAGGGYVLFRALKKK